MLVFAGIGFVFIVLSEVLTYFNCDVWYGYVRSASGQATILGT